MIDGIARLTISAIALAALVGCVTTSRNAYPSNWPAMIAPNASDCSYAAGLYGGERPADAVPAEFSYPLVVWLAGRARGAVESNFSEVEVLVFNSIATVRARRGVSEPWVVVPAEGWKCVEGRLVGPPIERRGGEGQATWHLRGTTTLEKTVDGALVVHLRQSEAYQSMVFLHNDKEEAWVRYEAIKR